MAKKEKHGLFYKLAGVGTMKTTFNHTKDMVKSVTKKDPNDYIKETYEEALNRHGIPVEERDAYVAQIYKNLKITFIIMMGAVCLFIIFGIIMNLIKGNIIPAFLYLSLCFAFTSVAANNSLRCFQIRRKELGGLSEWFKSPKNWYPSSLEKAWTKDDLNKS